MRRFVAYSLAISLLAGCATLPEQAFVVTEAQLARRQIETRRYDDTTEDVILVASSNVLQDLGFTLENSETKLGVITASKQRDATNAGEIAAAVLIAALGGGVMATSQDQTIRVSLVVRPVQKTDDTNPTGSYFARITFQRIVHRTDNSVFIETLDDESLYVEFFEQLSKSVFLEAQRI
jgi:hypothetical protein